MDNPKIVETPKIDVQTGIIIPKEAYHVTHHPSVSGNAIRIGIQDSNAHFIQFVTRQCPDLFDPTGSGKPPSQWDPGIDTHYMSTHDQPRWRVDSASHPNPFYETSGASEKKQGWIYIYDEPGLGMDEERVVFCTFLISQNRIFKEVQWSKQEEVNGSKVSTTYSINIRDANKLPDWAIKTLKDDYDSNKAGGGKLIYEIPEFLKREITSQASEILSESKVSFLPPPHNWMTLKDHPQLFSKTPNTVNIAEHSANSPQQDSTHTPINPPNSSFKI